MRPLVVFVLGLLIGGVAVAAAFLVFPAIGQPSPCAVDGTPTPDGCPLPPSVAGAGASDSTPTLAKDLDRAAPALDVTPAEAAFLAKTLAEERRRAFEARIRPEDGGLDVLRRVFEERADPTPVLADFDRFAARVRHAEGKSTRFLDPPTEKPLVLRESDAKDASILEFGPGTFRIDAEHWVPAETDLRNLEIRGAGKDRTTLVLTRNLLLTQKRLEHLRIRDLSIETADGMALDVRGDVAAILEDVRFLPWQVAGHAAPIGVSGKAYLGLRRCEFFAGGHRAGFGISLRGPALVLAEECIFADLAAAVIGGDEKARGSVVRLNGCRFLGSPVADRGAARGEVPGTEIRVTGGDALLGGKDLPDEERRLRWGAQFTTAVDGVRFAADPESSTVGELLDVLDRVRTEVTGTVLSVARVAGRRLGQPGWYVVYAWDGESSRAAANVVRWGDGRPTVAIDPAGGGPQVPQRRAVDALRPLAEIVRSASLSPSTPASEVTLQVDSKEARVFVMHARRHAVVIDARSGEVHVPKR